MQTTPNAAVIPTQVTVVNFSILTDTRNHVRNPVIVMETTFENIHPLSANPRNSRPVTAIPTIPSTPASRYQVQNVHTSPLRRNADSATRKTAGMTLIIVFLIISGFINSYSPIL